MISGRTPIPHPVQLGRIIPSMTKNRERGEREREREREREA